MCCSGPCWSNPHRRQHFQYSHPLNVLSGFQQGSHAVSYTHQAQEFLGAWVSMRSWCSEAVCFTWAQTL